MAALTIILAVIWLVFWSYWLISAIGNKPGTYGRLAWLLRVVALIVLLFLFRRRHLHVGLNHNLAVGVIGLVIVLAGLGLAVWARVHLGRNWGMPMSRRDEPELVSSGPYRMVRHPIYTGLLLALVGTAIALNLALLVVVVVAGIYFVYAAKVEERNLVAGVPGYDSYRDHTKMMIPYVL